MRARPGVSSADGCSGSGSGAAEWSGSAGRCVIDPCGGRGRPSPGADCAEVMASFLSCRGDLQRSFGMTRTRPNPVWRPGRFGFESMGWVLRRARPGVSWADGCPGSGSGAAVAAGSALLIPAVVVDDHVWEQMGQPSCEAESVARPPRCGFESMGSALASGSAEPGECGWMLWKREFGGRGRSGRGNRSWGRFRRPVAECSRSRSTFGRLATTTRSRSGGFARPSPSDGPVRLREHGLGVASGSAGRVEGGWMLWKWEWCGRVVGFGGSLRHGSLRWSWTTISGSRWPVVV